jgi:two-component system NarL family sensor kinase
MAQPARRWWVLAASAVGVVLVVVGLVIALRVANAGAEPEHQNWWLVAELVLGLAYVPSGVLLSARPDRRLLGATFLVVGVAALVDALATQYMGYTVGRAEAAGWPGFASLSTWAWVLGSAVLATLVVLALPARTSTGRGPALVGGLVGAAGIGLQLLPHVTAPWPTGLGPNPLEVSRGSIHHLFQLAGDVGAVVVGLVASLAVALMASQWRIRRRVSDDPLPGWLLGGALVAWLAVVPPTIGLIGRHLPAPDVVQPLLLLATVPLLAIGALVDLGREAPSGLDRVSHRFVEWVLLAAGIVVIYTGVVAGLGRLVGGSGPTWFLVASTGAIALLVEPARRGLRSLVDRLVYGSRDDPLALVRQVMDHVSSAGEGDELLPSLATSLGREMCLDAVTIDVATPRGWEQVATYGGRVEHSRTMPLRHRDEVVGRLTVGWKDAPSLRARDAAALQELAAPLALAVSWVRLASDLRRSSLAIVSAREEERRRLRRDLHDGLGPALTGISLGLRTAIRQIERSRPDPERAATPLGLLTRVADEIDVAVGEVKRIVRDLRPTVLDQLGLVGAVSEFARTLDETLQVHLELPRAAPALPAAVEVAVYRIVTEALTNVVRHAAAASCWLRIDAGEAVEIDVVDDGIGLRAGAPVGIGLTAMKERAAELGGTMTLSANRPHGTRLHVRLPAALP